MEAAGPQPGPQPGPGPAAGPQPGAEDIDMSLDDIIKRHRKEQTDASAARNRQRQQVKNRNSAYGYRRPRFRAWMQRNLQGPNRFRRGFGQQQYNRRQFRNAVPGPRRRAAAALNGVSPLNRQAPAQEGSKNTDAFAKSSSSGQLEGRRQPPPGPKRFRAAAASTHALGRSLRETFKGEGMLLKTQLRWAEHICKMADHRLPKIVFYGELATSCRKRRAPKRT